MSSSKILFYLAFVFYFVSAFLYVSNSYNQEKNSLIAEIDTNLTKGALATISVLPENFHHQNMSKEDVGAQLDMQNIKRLSRVANLSSLQYIYTCIKSGETIYFTSSSATDEELAKNENLSHFFDVYEAKDGLKRAFSTGKIVFDEYTDKWGYFRSVFIPQKSSDGQVFVVCADVKIDFVKQQLDRVLRGAVLEMLFYVFILIPLFLAYYRHNKMINSELEVKVKERTKQVRRLLDHANEGFLSFGTDLLIHKEYSAKCVEIFDKEITGQRIDELIFVDENRREFYANTIIGLASETDELNIDNILSLLPREVNLGTKIVDIEYKMVEPGLFMLIITDITAKKELEKSLQKEKNVLKMVVSCVSNPAESFELLDDYGEFVSKRVDLVQQNETPMHNLAQMYRTVHTYKGLFAQKDFITTPQGLHKLETRLSKFLENNSATNQDLIDILGRVELEKWLDRDLSVLSGVLGEEFLGDKNKIAVKESVLQSIEQKIQEKASQTGDTGLADIATTLANLRKRSLVAMLSSFTRLVEQLAIRLDKAIYPMEPTGNTNIYVSDEYKYFVKSLVHVFRNCVDHGIESPECRVEVGKDEKGTILCDVAADTQYIYVSIRDDGRGIDTEAIANKAISKGLFSKEQIESMSESELIELIYLDNFSTSNEVSELSGRGVGLSAVVGECTKIGGRIEVVNNPGEGVTFTFILPRC